MKFQDLTGQRFDRWLVVNLDYKGNSGVDGKRKFTHWWCRCDCGAVKSVQATNLKRNLSASCGCLRTEVLTTHGMSEDPLYHVWANIVARCTNPTHVYFDRYGGRDVSVSDKWIANFPAFKVYVDSILGPKPSNKHTIDRIDNDGSYVEGNLRWATLEQQGSNKSNNVRLTLNGVTMTLSEWARARGISKDVLGHRLKAGWTISEVLLTPIRAYTTRS